MKLSFLCKNSSSAETPWTWPPSCYQQPKTLSFRNNDSIFKTMNSAYLDMNESISESDSASFSTAVSEEITEPTQSESIESVIEAVKSSKRLVFEQKGETNSILEEANEEKGELGFMLLSMESKDPFSDFKKSMEEMVESNGLKSWEDLEELLSRYLKSNCKSNHGYILGAFMELLLGFSVSSSSAESNETTTSNDVEISTRDSGSCSCSNARENSPSSPLSFCSSSNFSPSASCLSSSSPFVSSSVDSTPSCLSSLFEAGDKIKDANL